MMIDPNTNDLGYCESCKRVFTDWSVPESKELADGLKTLQHHSPEERDVDYRNWRRTFGHGAYVNDLDQLEWRVIDGEPTPIAHFELSRVDGDAEMGVPYFAAAWARFTQRDPQSSVSAIVARSLGVPAYFVLFRWNLEDVWVRQFDAQPSPNGYIGRWRHFTKDDFRQWVIDLPVPDRVSVGA